ncbi:tRNA preQ1(34) S-adenosylmethionine ribosyltransferase-isomerase QueA [Leptospira fletcheri]|uniref:S-adenosylmethionine:tRNA ribosyltransferase-isomerase n=1 Tax=Leptospira fletcheri TaxID=2484981 RepID=A0A4R9GB83_9LEPT|nr:tRNA preQ1(34) S-adenosylmethionine ribosyltransferase-isomerase QueA [Leptospira fletcheri]TGK08923.1 tRNA preQ1(34) S-adenosylmethionine ribosyltransferase-isomerase QueA [Leptospira fletcheri]
MEIGDLSEYSFNLPEDLIAKVPASDRDGSRLLVLSSPDGVLKEEPFFSEILKYLKEGDVLVANSTRVARRRVFLRTPSGRRHEALFLDPSGRPNEWRALVRNSKKLKSGTVLQDEISGRFSFTVTGREEEFTYLTASPDFMEIDFETIGRIPIPPYFKRESSEEDSVRYQTVYSKILGSVAAPTAGLHFTPELLERIRTLGVEFAELELRVGYGTFSTLTATQFREKKLHEEFFSISSEVAETLRLAKKQGRRIISVGTTTLRALEAAYDSKTRSFLSGESSTRLFLQPGDPILSCDCLITNFHLPESSLLLLVCAFAGKDAVLNAYRYALQNGFRFYSYGDAMLLLNRL